MVSLKEVRTGIYTETQLLQLERQLPLRTYRLAFFAIKGFAFVMNALFASSLLK